MQTGPTSPQLVPLLADIVGQEHLLVADQAAGFATDWTGRFGGVATTVVRPADVAEVAALVALCRQEGAAIVPQGGNTGLVGGSVPSSGEVVVSLKRLDTVDEVDPVARQVTVGAGVRLEMVQMAASRAGLDYAVDFGARGSATVGGMVALT